MKMLKKYSLFITISLIILVVSVVYDIAKVSNTSTLQVVNGCLDLSHYNLQEGPIKLSGEWELYKNQLLTYEDFQNNHYQAQLQNVPGSFQPNHISNIKGYGYGTYRLKVKTNDINKILGLKILTMSTSYKLMINNEVVATNGIVATNKQSYKSSFRPQIAIFNNTNREFDIIVQVANYTYNRTGMWHSMILGDYQQVMNLKKQSTHRALFLLGGILFTLIYHIGIFFLQKKNNKTNLYLIISLSIMLTRILFTGDYLITSLLPKISVALIARVEYLTIVWGPPAIALFNYTLFKDLVSKISVKLTIGCALVCTILILILPTHFYTNYVVVIEIIYLIVFGYLICSINKAIQKNRTFAVLCTIGYSSVICACILDVLYYMNIINIIDGGLTPYSVFSIITIQMFIVAHRYEKSFEDIRKLSTELIKQDKIKDDFLAYTSHEIKTPLQGMIGLIEHIIENGENLYDTQKENLTYAVKSGRRLSQLVNNILDYAKLKNNDIKLQLKSVTLLSVAHFVINTQKYLANNQDIEISCNIDPKIRVYGDENRLIQILTNLVSNSLKFTKQGEIKISCIKQNTLIRVCVEDTGCGIPLDKLQQIFKAYNQVNHTNSVLGTGLGLSISKQLVKLHGGEIWAESDSKTGSKFYFTLQASKNTVSQLSLNFRSKPRLKNIKQQSFSKIKILKKNNKNTILIVDDDSANLQVLINILSTEDYKLIVTCNSKEAVKAIEQYKIDIAILDIMMDEISGYDLCKIIRSTYNLYQLPVLMITAQTHTEAMIHGFKLGANDFLTKPFSSEELKARISTLINMRTSAIEVINNKVAFLQAQIKPHFIYNALNVIVSLCDTDPNKASDLLIDFSSYLRKSFDFSNTKNFVPIESEIEYIKSYLAIEQVRFENKIKCNFNIKYTGFMIPPLILQPLVENCVKHGILKKVGNGEINISIYKKNLTIYIIVEDDGVGISKNKLNTILSDTDTVSKSVGLKNINKRLQHYYGVGLKIDSSIQKGCRFIIEIPENIIGEEY